VSSADSEPLLGPAGVPVRSSPAGSVVRRQAAPRSGDACGRASGDGPQRRDAGERADTGERADAGERADTGEREETCDSGDADGRIETHDGSDTHVSGSGRVAVLASGSGTILEALLAAGVPVVLVVTDRACRAYDVAAAGGVQAVLLERKSFGADFDRDGYTEKVVATVREAGVDLVAMAGFGTILGAALFAEFPGSVLNTHPSLLPAFKGWHAVRDALEAGVAVTGCTVHVVTEQVDEGPVLAQEEVPVLTDDTVASLHERIKRVERRLYPAAVSAALDSRARARR
jgi:phosphoribosylglycinamide formyltransferase-1